MRLPRRIRLLPAGRFATALRVLLILVVVCWAWGRLVRDAVPGLSVFTYFTLPLSLAWLTIALLLAKDPRRRWRRLAVAVVVVMTESVQVVSPVGFDAPLPGGVPLRVLHWNVQWGGNTPGGSGWPGMADRIVAEKPDVVVLSEAPMHDDDVQQLCDRLGPEWQFARMDFVDANVRYYVRTRILARRPVTLTPANYHWRGTAALARIGGPTPFSVLIVDGLSGQAEKDTFLKIVADAARQHRPDVIAGDFNATPANRGFRDVYTAGYRDAAARGGSFRPTWPSTFPLLQIDHVLIRDRHRIVHTHSFYNAATDHRGRVVDVQLVP